jgi:hypothetical protein
VTHPPDLASLTRGLATLLCPGQSGSEEFTVLDRVPNLYASSAASEVVTCHTDGGRTIRVVCKYGHRGHVAEGHGHRHGLAYEAYLYRRILPALGAAVPHCYGTYEEPNERRTWLVLEHLDRALRVNLSPDPQAIVSAAGWVGRFHAAGERGTAREPAHLREYDADYYRGWAYRTLEFARRTGHATPWLRELCEHADGFIGPLLEAPVSVIHGELYPENLLCHEGRIIPIDWETAAVAAGEIDLASLIEAWPTDVARACEQEYQRSRWPLVIPQDFRRTLDAARVYWSLRWLGDRPEWLLDQHGRRYFRPLRAAGERLGLL